MKIEELKQSFLSLIFFLPMLWQFPASFVQTALALFLFLFSVVSVVGQVLFVVDCADTLAIAIV
jgi:membrane-anchored protein YejM (alkaline phosphatase superfamily)